LSSAAVSAIEPANLWVRAAAYVELTKPRVVAMILITALAGFYMGSGAEFNFVRALEMLGGTALAAGGTLALNQYLERDFDAMMLRTCSRPLPSGRLKPRDALIFGITTGLAGILFLYVAVNPLSAAVTCAIGILYLGGYTPMKRWTWLCHMVGGIPGALPPIIGWAAARGSLDAAAFVLFGIMLLWQLPHSLSIARIYQADYARAGLSLLPLDRPGGNPVNGVMITASGLLVGFGSIPTWMGFAGRIYLAVALILGLWLMYRAIRLAWKDTTAAAARNVMMVSLVYLPVVLLAMVLDKA
jgi:protoheme IX farnesyltransferase